MRPVEIHTHTAAQFDDGHERGEAEGEACVLADLLDECNVLIHVRPFAARKLTSGPAYFAIGGIRVFVLVEYGGDAPCWPVPLAQFTQDGRVINSALL